jgi:hypothetical protein
MLRVIDESGDNFKDASQKGVYVVPEWNSLGLKMFGLRVEAGRKMTLVNSVKLSGR